MPPIFILLMLSAAACVAVGVFALRLRLTPGAVAFALSQFVAAFWTLAYAAILAAPELDDKTFFWKVQMIGVVLLPATWLVFTARFSFPWRRVPRWVLALLTVEPGVMLALAWTNEAHQLLLQDTWLLPVGTIQTLGRTFGPLMYVHTAYSSILTLVGVQWLLLAAARAGPFFRRITAILVLSVFMIGFAQVLWMARATELVLDPTPGAFAIGALISAWALGRLRLLDVPVLARDALFEAAADAAIALDRAWRVIDGNPAAARLFEPTATFAVGARLADLLQGRANLAQWRSAVTQGRGEVDLATSNGWRVFEVQARDVHPDKTGGGLGRLVVLRDITERRAAAAALAASNQALRAEVAARTRTLHRQQVLLQAARQSAAETDPSRLLASVVEAAMEAVDARVVGVYRCDERQGRLRLVHAQGDATLEPEIQVGDGTVGDAAFRKATVVGLREAVFPLVHEGQLFGALTARARDAGFGDEEIGALELLAATTAAALVAHERVRLQGVLLAAYTAQHELSNRLTLTAGYASVVANHQDATPRLKEYARQAEEGAREAGEMLRRLSKLTRIEELDWGDMGVTISLSDKDESAVPAGAARDY